MKYPRAASTLAGFRPKVHNIEDDARSLFSNGRYAESAEAFRRELETRPNDPACVVGLGAALHRLGKHQEAVQVLERAVALDSDSPVAHDNLAVVLRLTGRPADAFDHHRRALELDPDYAPGLANYGYALEIASETDDALSAYERAARTNDKLPAVHCGIGRIKRQQRLYQEAEASFRTALAIEPERAAALAGLGDVLATTHRYPESLRVLRRLCRIHPRNPVHRLTLARVLSAASRDHEALPILRALKRQGFINAQLLFAEAVALSNLGKYHAASRAYQRAFAIEPHSPFRSSYIFMLHASALKSRRAMLREVQVLDRLSGTDRSKRERFCHERNLDPDRPLRIGYLSPDFRQHVVRQFFEPVMRVHDSDRFEFCCYAEIERPDIATASLSAVADRWLNTIGLSDEEVAARIEDDGIDVLVDLAGHTANNRLGVMRLRPAPVQATYLGYFGSTGVSTIDYWITDEVLHPADTREPATETIHRLPRTAFCYGVPDHARRRTKRSGERHHVTFGCFNNVSKVGLPVVDAWAEILRRSTGAGLILKDRRFGFSAVRRTWRRRFARRGIAPDRVELLPASSHDRYMASYNDIDIALDPFPRTGGTTTCDALWMGVPVVTLAGGRYVERLSATKLSAVGADDLITGSVEHYIEKAIELAEDRTLLQRYHAELRSRMAKSPLCDPLGLAQALESAYRTFWRRYIAARAQGG